eukprot:4342351-Prymnesium_polylepis.1
MRLRSPTECGILVQDLKRPWPSGTIHGTAVCRPTISPHCAGRAQNICVVMSLLLDTYLHAAHPFRSSAEAHQLHRASSDGLIHSWPRTTFVCLHLCALPARAAAATFAWQEYHFIPERPEPFSCPTQLLEVG